MKYIRVVIVKGGLVHHLNTDMPLEAFAEKIEEGEPFNANYHGVFGRSYYVNRIIPSEILVWYEEEQQNGFFPVFQY